MPKFSNKFCFVSVFSWAFFLIQNRFRSLFKNKLLLAKYIKVYPYDTKEPLKKKNFFTDMEEFLRYVAKVKSKYTTICMEWKDQRNMHMHFVCTARKHLWINIAFGKGGWQGQGLGGDCPLFI